MDDDNKKVQSGPLSMPWTEQETYVINKYDLKLRFSIDIQVISLKSKKQQDKNKKVCFTEDWLDTICTKSSVSLLEVLDNQIRNEINVMKENKMFFKTENLQKLIGRPVIAMALDHPLLKKIPRCIAI